MAIEKGLYGMPEGIDGELMGEEMTPDAMVGIDVVTEGDLPVMRILKTRILKDLCKRTSIAPSWTIELARFALKWMAEYAKIGAAIPRRTITNVGACWFQCCRSITGAGSRTISPPAFHRRLDLPNA